MSVAKLRAKRQRVNRRLLELSERILIGSISQSYRTCGRQTCRCRTTGPKHGPHLYMSYKGESGKTTGYYIRQSLHEEVHCGVDAWREFNALAKEIADLNRQIMLAEDDRNK